MEAAQRKPHENLACLCLTDEESVQRALVEYFAGLGMQLTVYTPRTSAEAQSLARNKGCAFTVAHLQTAVGELSSLLPVRSVQSPPLVVVTDWKPAPGEREQLRLQGAAQVLEWPLGESSRAIRTFADANSTFKVSQEFMVVTDVLQTMATRKRSGLVTVSCPHHIDFGVDEWQNGAACEGGEEGCAGWYGRLYLVDGALVHAETPTLSSVPALAQMIDLHHSTIRIQSVFVEPPQPNLSGPLENSILNAALLIDNNKKKKPLLKAVPPPIPRPPKRSEKMKLETFTTVSPEVRAVVRADPGGEVLEAVGSVDAESLSAVVGMCAAPLERLAELMGLSGLGSWSFTAEGSSLFVYRDDKGYTAVAAGSGKNPEVSFKKLGTLVKGRLP